MSQIRLGQPDHTPPNTNGIRDQQPAQIRFHEHEVPRIPVEVSLVAQEIIDTSSSEGRKWPLALSEHFGMIKGITKVTIDAVRKSTYFHVSERELHPITGEGPYLFIVTAYHEKHPEHAWYVNASDLSDLHPNTREVMFRARFSAQELTRLYPHQGE